MRTRMALLIAMTVAASPAAAGNYRWIAPDGSVSYSDNPPRVNATTVVPVAPPRPVAIPAPVLDLERLPAGPAAAVDEILHISGLTRQIGGLSASLIAEFKAPPSFSSKERAAIGRVAERSFHRDRLLASITEELRRRQDQPRLNGVAAWLRSPLGQKITTLEIAASLAGTAGRPAPASAAPPARMPLIERLDWLGGLTENRLDTILVIARATAISVAGVMPPEQRKTPPQIERDLERARGQMRPRVEEATRQHLLQLYAALDDTELERVAAFMSSESGRWYSGVMSRALTQAIGAAATEAAGAMVGVVPAERWRALAMAPPPAPR